ncbi:hypothetical protein CBM2592_A220022 [Cupriavidus taiwanensis]|nr:hypothetical protein CBM2592_A220022 [Cupriavidus taiwanensis]SOZ57536.1 hypothetical protein CBM2617_A240022 [Cupriavidus taiwanensis]SOZ79441.1 hypothetical protein CBM2618_A220022 [Cupriavidus taiwanensis]SOZ87676.1 hypothetical protein CBM2621_A210022 [Cupriavidus taiwanensis]SPA14642.1 hypothetical protein CBM2631_A250022 [Cupriavidus taiwanensis]
MRGRGGLLPFGRFCRLTQVDTPALSPGPSPAGGRGQQTGSLSGPVWCLPSPARGRGAGERASASTGYLVPSGTSLNRSRHQRYPMENTT